MIAKKNRQLQKQNRRFFLDLNNSAVPKNQGIKKEKQKKLPENNLLFLQEILFLPDPQESLFCHKQLI